MNKHITSITFVAIATTLLLGNTLFAMKTETNPTNTQETTQETTQESTPEKKSLLKKDYENAKNTWHQATSNKKALYGVAAFITPLALFTKAGHYCISKLAVPGLLLGVAYLAIQKTKTGKCLWKKTKTVFSNIWVAYTKKYVAGTKKHKAKQTHTN